MSKTIHQAVAERVRVELAIAQVKPAELARRLRVSHAYLSRRLTGETSFDLADLERIGKVLGLPIARILAPALDLIEVAA